MKYQVPPETHEQVGTALSDETAGGLILKADEYGARLDALGQEEAQKAIDLAVEPDVTVEETVWGQ